MGFLHRGKIKRESLVFDNHANRCSQTKGPSLEQVALLFDGKDAKVAPVNPVADVFLEKEEVEGREDHVHEGNLKRIRRKSTYVEVA